MALVGYRSTTCRQIRLWGKIIQDGSFLGPWTLCVGDPQQLYTVVLWKRLGHNPCKYNQPSGDGEKLEPTASTTRSTATTVYIKPATACMYSTQ